ncbi:hypothetical protein EJ03DRAFT_355051 [Teratosphaeria nubilosa]|uniref:BTB domain-containing protein n=1 Tax=Teratosphaeria nubilosa TaxID=161662 RepID=A0A6G1KYM0_9PEZI|nr:hypothetical protein EJ03DRAFT_355051 [Teratosphaeria nubilosa]
MANDGQPAGNVMRWNVAHTVSISLGLDRRIGMTLQVPRNLICARSKLVWDYFARSHAKVFKLDDYQCAPDTFSAYLQLLYTDQVVLRELESQYHDDGVYVVGNALLRLHDLAGHLGDVVPRTWQWMRWWDFFNAQS